MDETENLNGFCLHCVDQPIAPDQQFSKFRLPKLGNYPTSL
jgi:glutathionylspermidine synthase